MSASALGKDNGLCLRSEDNGLPDKWQLQDTARKLLHDKRLSCCHRARAKGRNGAQKTISVMKGHDGSIFIGGLIRCGAVWICPVCARKEGQKRREEIKKAIKYGHDRKCFISMITLTFPHGHQHDSTLESSLTGQASALRKMKQRRTYRAWAEKYGHLGEIRTLELTHGQNGWHPHTHAITFFKNQFNATRCRRELYLLWARACLDAGLPMPNYKNGVTVQNASKVADYVTKWGMVEEMAGAELKHGQKGGRNTWQILNDAMNGDRRSMWLYRDFAKQIKGKRQIFWSPGLLKKIGLKRNDEKKLAAIDPLVEQTEMELQPPEPVQIATIDAETWSMVLRARGRRAVVDAARQSVDHLIGYLFYIRRTVTRPLYYFDSILKNDWSLERDWRNCV